jgi:hypothetical protein
MEIKRSGSQPSQKGPPEHFTGTVRIDPLFQSNPPARAAGAYVTFEPCSRSDWHTHPEDAPASMGARTRRDPAPGFPPRSVLAEGRSRKGAAVAAVRANIQKLDEGSVATVVAARAAGERQGLRGALKVVDRVFEGKPCRRRASET